MKKLLLLSAAALLAGTALSQAATAVFQTTVDSSATEVGPTTSTSTSGNVMTVTLGTGNMISTDNSNYLSYEVSLNGYTLGVSNGSTSGKWWNIKSTTSENIVSWAQLSNSSAASALSDATGESYTTGTDFSSYGTHVGSGGTLTITFSGLTKGQTYTIALVVYSASAENESALSTSATDITSYSYGFAAGNSWETVSVSSSSSSISISTVDSNNNSQLLIATFSLTATSDSVSFTVNNKGGLALASITAVPEPSSFGLLAGLVALALVASRRRRVAPAGIVAG